MAAYEDYFRKQVAAKGVQRVMLDPSWKNVSARKEDKTCRISMI